MKAFSKRVLVSFSGRCPLECKHCYTLDGNGTKSTKDNDEIEKLIASIRGLSFDIIYISHDRENFVDEQAGIQLTKSLYETYHKSIFIITRKCLSQNSIRQLAALNKQMADNKHDLFVAISIPANSSYGITERVNKIAPPLDRCELLKRLHQFGIKCVFLARPIFPEFIVPTNEIVEMISEYRTYIDAVVASGLAVNDSILERLGLVKDQLKYLPGNNAEFLIGSSAKNIKYIDVSSELSVIEEICTEYGIVFSTHSMDALNKLACM